MKHTTFLAGAAVALALSGAAIALADGFDPRRPQALVVGAPVGPAPMARVGPRRDGRTSHPLPTKKLHVEWKKSTGAPLENPPLVDDGRVVVVGARGDVVSYSPDGDERARVSTSGSGPGPAAMLGDGTVVFVSASGEIVGARGSARRFAVRAGASAGAKVAPLPLADGGFVAAIGAELLLLDAAGTVRARAQAQEALVGPLLAHGGRVVGASRSGAVFTWVPGGEVIRVGSFRGTIDAGLALDDGGKVVAVVDQTQVVELDLARGSTTTRATAAAGSLYLGPPALGPSGAAIFGLTFGVAYAVVVDRTGAEGRIAIGAAPPAGPTLLPDGGTPAVVVPPHAGVLVDTKGTLAFVAPDGTVGVASRESGTSTLGEPPCGRNPARGFVPGLAPAGPNAFYVACESGTLAKIAGD